MEGGRLFKHASGDDGVLGDGAGGASADDLRRLEVDGGGPDPAVGGELRSLGSNERHEAGLRRLEVAGEDPDR